MSFFTLKIVALLSMLWDHVTYVWPLSLTLQVLLFPNAAETVPALLALQRATDYIGRIAAPIFLFSIANGYRHTRNFKKYALRLLIFACLAEYPYYLLFSFHGNLPGPFGHGDDQRILVHMRGMDNVSGWFQHV